MALSERLTRAQEILGHEFNNKVLLRAALTHPSSVEGLPVSASYERLEFLGDSILGAVVARSLFESYPEFDEGKLTRLKVSLVSGATLSEVSHELGIDDIIIFGASETGTGARGLHSALENVYESLVGALGPAHAPTFTAVVLIDGIRRAAAPGPPRRRPRGPLHSRRSTAWATPPTA